ncbi:hypothetical protein [Tychonema sp. BBK16]|uniref:hypothetical protein n=1 Tax=Tychonema sp. BBK16 TaxID=2699888 RepID=UPI001F29DA8C|nr:hypothetical protein [Tychonema sp. BBK16]MCF6374798.1 hypothetical protein [Tychonema sp. BBK16]
MSLPSKKTKLINFIFLQIALMQQIFLVATRQIKMMLYHQRGVVINLFKDDEQPKNKRPKILVAIAHITSVEESNNQEKATAKIERLRHTIDGLLTSFAHCDLSIVVHTLPNRHITAYLPEYQINCIQVQEGPECDPMFVEFRLQEEFVNKVDEFEWFLFIEDDIILYDAFTIEKLEKFNQQSGFENAILYPNRYEMYEGTKRYIDLTVEKDFVWNKLSSIEIEEVKFAEFSNPHAAFYCLSRKQMKQWIKSGRTWKNQVINVGPLESAATFCLLECFSIYKPHPSNLNYFEVRHYDSKYSQLYPEPESSYTLSAVDSSAKKDSF